MPSPTQLEITLHVTTQENGHSLCQANISTDAQTVEHLQFYGQSPNHAIAIALENLASHYRQAADAQQPDDWTAVERSSTGEVITKRYHVILHYEQVTEDESKFEAMHNTIMGNTVVENAAITLIEVAQDLPLEPIVR